MIIPELTNSKLNKNIFIKKFNNLKIINKRIKWNNKRPLLKQKNSEEIIKKLYSERKNIYKLAKYKINCNNLTKEDIAKKIIFFYENYKIKH